MKDPRFAKFTVFVNGAVPLALLGWDAKEHQLGPNPALEAIHITGVTAIIFIALTLAITPVRKITGWNWLSHFRRMLGLYAFLYATIHFLIYFAYQRDFSVAGTIEDVKKSPFILYGMIALFLMIPLAITSTNDMIKWLGAAKWKRLHQLVYLVAIAAAVHYWMNGKITGAGPKIFATVLTILLASRIVFWQLAEQKKSRMAAQAGAR